MSLNAEAQAAKVSRFEFELIDTAVSSAGVIREQRLNNLGSAKPRSRGRVLVSVRPSRHPRHPQARTNRRSPPHLCSLEMAPSHRCIFLPPRDSERLFSCQAQVRYKATYIVASKTLMHTLSITTWRHFLARYPATDGAKAHGQLITTLCPRQAVS